MRNPLRSVITDHRLSENHDFDWDNRDFNIKERY